MEREDKESPYVVGYRYKMGLNELGMRRTRFYTITESTLDDRKDSHPPLTV